MGNGEGSGLMGEWVMGKVWIMVKQVFSLLLLGLLAACTQMSSAPAVSPTVEPVTKTAEGNSSDPTDTPFSEQTPARKTRPATKTPTDWITRTPTPTAVPTQTPDFVMISGADLEDFNPVIMLNTMRSEWWGSCIPVGDAKLWRTQYPYDQFDLFLSSSAANYYGGIWSPDGEWIAYIESRPGTVETTPDGPQPIKSGTDQVWLIRPDQTEKIPIGNPLPAVDVLWRDSCEKDQFIFPDLRWSPNSRYLVYAHVTAGSPTKWVYYLYDLKTGSLYEHTDLRGNNPFRWSADGYRALLIREDDQIVIAEIDEGVIRASIETPPPDTGEVHIRNLYWGSADTGIIAHTWKPASQQRSWDIGEQYFWEFDLSAGEWHKKFDFKDLPFTEPQQALVTAGKTYAMIQYGDAYVLLNFHTWSLYGPFPVSEGWRLSSGSKWFSDKQFGELLISSVSDGGRVYLAAARLEGRDMRTRQLIDAHNGWFAEILDYSWSGR
jgi:hypothetical protein